MFNFIKFGKLLGEGIHLYQQKKYIKAKSVFSQALTISHQDFIANFWMARSLTMLSDYRSARELLLKCRELNSKNTEWLLEPWETLIYGLENDYTLFSRRFDKYNIETDQNLQTCYFKKKFTMKEIVTISLLAISAIFVTAIGYQYWNYSGMFIAALLMIILQLSYFHFNTLIPLNFWLRYQWIKEQIGVLAYNHSFIRLNAIIIICVGVYVLGIMAFLSMSPKSKIHIIEILQNSSHQPLAWMYTFVIHLLAPISEELTFRLVWYNYLLKYNKYLAYLGVSFLFMIVHLSMNPVHFLLSLILIWSYNKYQTLLAPIIIHFIYNFSYSIFELLGFKIFM